MSLVSVYRYEHPSNGFGPYSVDAFPDLRDELCDVHEDRPGLRHILQMDYDDVDPWRSACRTLDDLHRWFMGYNKRLKELGFVVRCYEVPREHVVFDVGQVAFYFDAANKLAGPESHFKGLQVST